jgi:hypothetical protein
MKKEGAADPLPMLGTTEDNLNFHDMKQTFLDSIFSGKASFRNHQECI